MSLLNQQSNLTDDGFAVLFVESNPVELTQQAVNGDEIVRHALSMMGVELVCQTPSPRSEVRTPDVDMGCAPVPVGPLLSFRDVHFSSSEEMEGRGFPYDVPDELSKDEAEAVERALAAPLPTWLAGYLAQRKHA